MSLKIWTEGDEILADDLNKTGIGFRALAKATPDLQLSVEPGVVVIQGTTVKYAGGNSGSFSAPSSNPRIDLLCIDTAGALSIVQGTEASSPVAPDYPSGKFVIAEVYLRTTATSIKNLSDGTNGYIYRDVRAFTSGSGEQMVATFVAAETIAADDAIAATLYSTGSIGYDTSGQNSSSSFSITVGNNSNRVLVVLVNGASSGNNAITGTYNGVALTQASSNYFSSSGNNWVQTCLYLVAPATGSNTLSLSQSGSFGMNVHYWSLYNAAQTSPIDASNATGAGSGSTSVSVSTTAVSDGCLGVGFVRDNGGSSSIGSPTGNTYAANTSSGSNPGWAQGTSGTSNLYGAGTTFTISTSGATAQYMFAMIALVKPYAAPVAAVQKASSASANTRNSGFLGFAQGGASAGGSLIGTIAGVHTFASKAIAAGTNYYLNDTQGTIGSSAGSQSRKVGVGLGNKRLLITNIW